MLRADEAAALALLSELPISLSIKLKREVRNWIVKRNPAGAEEFELSRALRIAMTKNAADVAKLAFDYVRLRDKYVEVDASKMSGAPVIRGTRVPVRTLAQLEGGENREVLREDFPHIPEEASMSSIRAHPPPLKSPRSFQRCIVPSPTPNARALDKRLDRERQCSLYD